MARGRGRGGYQRPSSPAGASGPGALSQRTDGRPSPEYSGLGYGDNKAVNEQSRSAPMAGRGSGGGGGGGAAPQRGGGQPPVGGPGSVFAPTQRPREPLTAGVDAGAGPSSPRVPRFDDDVNYVVRAIAAENPHLADYLLALADT